VADETQREMPDAAQLYGLVPYADTPREMTLGEWEQELEKARIDALANLHDAPTTIQ
jgi:hypothetical protein